MRSVAISLLALATQSGCFALHAHVPEEVVRQHVAREHGVEMAAICSQDGRRFSEGAAACMQGRRMTCDASGRWVEGGSC